MNLILPIVAAVVPCLLIAYVIYRLDRYDKEPVKLLVACFVLGGLLTYPALLLEEWAFHQGWDRGDHLGYLLLTAFIIVALNEELVKFIVLRLFAYPKRAFDEPLDGIVYTLMIGMGFATVENVLYAFRSGLPTVLVRALTAVPAHAVFAVFMGYYIGHAKFSTPSWRRKRMLVGFFVAVIAHGIYDFFIVQDFSEYLLLGAPIFLLISGYFAYLLLQKAIRQSKADAQALA